LEGLLLIPVDRVRLKGSYRKERDGGVEKGMGITLGKVIAI